MRRRRLTNRTTGDGDWSPWSPSGFARTVDAMRTAADDRAGNADHGHLAGDADRIEVMTGERIGPTLRVEPARLDPPFLGAEVSR